VRLTVSQVTAGTVIAGEFYAVEEVRVQNKKDGSPYLRARLRDATGVLDAVSWDEFEQRSGILQAGTIIKVRGPVSNTFNGDRIELTIQQIRPAKDGEYHLADFLPTSVQPIELLVETLEGLLTQIREPLQTAVRAAIEPELPRFARWPAAQVMHHAWLGGLLEHSIEVTRIALAVADTVPGLDRDVLLAGGLLHDIGKLDAYAIEASFLASDSGRLLGHVLTGYHRVQMACLQADLPPDETLRLLHIIASHHGQPEFGAAREPMTAEAIVIHYADELSAQLMQIRGATSNRRGDARWLDRVTGLKRDIFLGTE